VQRLRPVRLPALVAKEEAAAGAGAQMMTPHLTRMGQLGQRALATPAARPTAAARVRAAAMWAQGR
jgi:hypothetical protein